MEEVWVKQSTIAKKDMSKMELFVIHCAKMDTMGLAQSVGNIAQVDLQILESTA